MKIISIILGLGLTMTEVFAQTNTQAPLTSLAELPNWPVGIIHPSNITSGWSPVKQSDASKAEVLVWSAPGAKHIRAILFIPNNSDSKSFGEHHALREVARKRELAIVYLRRFDGSVVERTDPPVAINTIYDVLNIVAEQTGIAEFRYAPWITFGKSSRGRFPFRMSWLYPDKTIASISYHGETPTWPMADWSRIKDETILEVNVNGEVEWANTWYRHVRPSLLNYRTFTSWLPHQVVVHGVGHGNYADENGSSGWGKPLPSGAISCLQVWDYLALFIDKAIQLRVPEKIYPTNGPVKLKQVDPNSGYLIHPRAIEELFGARWRPLRKTDGVYQIVDHIKEPGQVYDENPGSIDVGLLIRKAANVPVAERKEMFWIADKELATAWLKLHNVNNLKMNLRK